MKRILISFMFVLLFVTTTIGQTILPSPYKPDDGRSSQIVNVMPQGDSQYQNTTGDTFVGRISPPSIGTLTDGGTTSNWRSMISWSLSSFPEYQGLKIDNAYLKFNFLGTPTNPGNVAIDVQFIENGFSKHLVSPSFTIIDKYDLMGAGVNVLNDIPYQSGETIHYLPPFIKGELYDALGTPGGALTFSFKGNEDGTQWNINSVLQVELFIEFSVPVKGQNVDPSENILTGSLTIDGAYVSSGFSHFITSGKEISVKTNQQQLTSPNDGNVQHYLWNDTPEDFRLKRSELIKINNVSKIIQEAEFKPYLQTTIEGKKLEGTGSVTYQFRDPWSVTGGSQPNTYRSFSSSTNFKVFEDQESISANPDIPFYEIKAPASSVSGGVTFNFLGWQYNSNDITLKTPANLVSGYYESEVVFKNENATLIPLYKAKDHSSDSEVVGQNTYRKIAEDVGNAKTYRVYSSGGILFFQWKNSGSTSWSDELVIENPGAGLEAVEPIVGFSAGAVWILYQIKAVSNPTVTVLNVARINNPSSSSPIINKTEVETVIGTVPVISAVAYPHSSHSAMIIARPYSSGIKFITAYGYSGTIYSNGDSYSSYISSSSDYSHGFEIASNTSSGGNNIGIAFSDGQKISYREADYSTITKRVYSRTFSDEVSGSNTNYTLNRQPSIIPFGSSYFVGWSTRWDLNVFLTQSIVARKFGTGETDLAYKLISNNLNSGATAFQNPQLGKRNVYSYNLSGGTPVLLAYDTNDNTVIYSENINNYGWLDASTAENTYSTSIYSSTAKPLHIYSDYKGTNLYQLKKYSLTPPPQPDDDDKKKTLFTESHLDSIISVVGAQHVESKKLFLISTLMNGTKQYELKETNAKNSSLTLVQSVNITHSELSFLYYTNFQEKRFFPASLTVVDQQGKVLANWGGLEPESTSLPLDQDADIVLQNFSKVTIDVHSLIGKDVDIVLTLHEADINWFTMGLPSSKNSLLNDSSAKEKLVNNDEQILSAPSEFSLSQNYPNPFNPITSINFSLPENAQIQVQVFDIQGRLVQTLYNGQKTSGHHSFSFDGSNLNSGIYLLSLNAFSVESSKSWNKSMTMTLLK